MWTANTFIVSGAELSGNQRLNAAQISSPWAWQGNPSSKPSRRRSSPTCAQPFRIWQAVRVQVGFPNHIYVNVVERTPILVWSQGGNITWIDSNGVSFTPRGNVPDLIRLLPTGTRPKCW